MSKMVTRERVQSPESSQKHAIIRPSLGVFGPHTDRDYAGQRPALIEYFIFTVEYLMRNANDVSGDFHSIYLTALYKFFKLIIERLKQKL